MSIVKQLAALGLFGVAGLMAGCGSDERAQIAAAIFPEARAAAPSGAAAEIQRKRHRGPPHAAAAAAAASASAN